MRSIPAVIGGLALPLLCAGLARAEDPGVSFTLGVPVEATPDGHTQAGRLLIPETLETALRWEVPAAREEMAWALEQRTAWRWCLGLSIPLLVGGVVNLAVAESGLVGDRTGTLAVYGVAIGLSTAAVGLAVAALVLSNRSDAHYQAAVDAYNASVAETPGVSMQWAPLPGGAATWLTLRF